MRYQKYSAYLVEKYGEKVYKIPVNLPCSCPNRDGTLGSAGCIFCGDVGAGFEAQPSELSISQQINRNCEYIQKKYKVNKFMIYFQNYTNTYIPIEQFEANLHEAVRTHVVGLSISTRPDSISNQYLEVLKNIQAIYNIDIEVELGLQSININTLKQINRGHGLAEFIDAVQRIHTYGFTVCAHLIANLPWDTDADFIEAGRVLSALKVESVKVHSLYILKNTKLGELYNAGAIELISAEAYLERLVKFIQNISSEMVIQRLFARAPESQTLFCNWGMSWRKLQNQFEAILEERNIDQGMHFELGLNKSVKVE
ncbi:TIGR01212 family radical SAM protein [Fusibacter sp. 3D3]|uniref:TIGR01212 family radical SAM protein n=1 Tax=Fusibacter sp. 3D3 TaxID=1048380 RepID=UPI0008533686|nr:TIGR01212 family radical SAM protein [Fusibacter sp. 3D3]GAU79441.1 predicted Fe-S oxidoreductase [Fusibacter sp. 3D3]